MNVLFVFLLVCGDPKAVIDLQNGKYYEPDVFTNAELAKILNKMDEHKLPYAVRELGEDCE